MPVKAQVLESYTGWHKEWNDTLRGSHLTAAREFMRTHGIKPRKTIVVGVIDSGIDPACEPLKGSLWTNRKEKPNGKDDDRNGYADDIHGWNFLGTKDGSFNMTSAGTEEFREFKRLYPKYKMVDEQHPEVSDPSEYAYYLRMKKKAGIASYIRFYGFAQQKAVAIQRLDSTLRTRPTVDADTLTVGGLLRAEAPDSMWVPRVEMILADLMRSDPSTRWPDFVRQQGEALELMARRLHGIEHDADKRLLMGDDMNNAADRFYGNATLDVEGADHGNFVASVIAARYAADSRMDGVWPQAQLLTVRCSPDGDEYDKDVASSIRYAVDNGAKVVNISLGKYTSPRADMVNEALAYAARKDVLVVTAAGNNHLNIDTIAYYPSAVDEAGRPLPNVIRVGATAMDGTRSSISNYGFDKVDLYAPGEYISGFYTGGKADMASGTSVAAPVVSGIAAMIRSCYPRLKAAEVKRILMETVVRQPGLECVSGGIVDALAAIRKASGK